MGSMLCMLQKSILAISWNQFAQANETYIYKLEGEIHKDAVLFVVFGTKTEKIF